MRQLIKEGGGHDRTSHLCLPKHNQDEQTERREKLLLFFSIDGNATMLIMVTALTTFSMYVSNGQALCHVNLPYLQETRDRYYNRITPTTEGESGGTCGLNQMGTI